MSGWIDLTLEELEASGRDELDETETAIKIAQEAKKVAERAREEVPERPSLPGLANFPIPSTAPVVKHKKDKAKLRKKKTQKRTPRPEPKPPASRFGSKKKKKNFKAPKKTVPKKKTKKRRI